MSPLSTRIARFQRAAEHPRAYAVYPAGVTLLTFVGLVVPMSVARGRLPSTTATVLLLALAGGYGLVMVGAVWTWRHFSGPATAATDPWSELVYERGVRQFGAPTPIVPLLVAAWYAWLNHGEGVARMVSGALLGLWSTAILFLLLGPWMGYWWGRMMAAAFRLPRPKVAR